MAASPTKSKPAAAKPAAAKPAPAKPAAAKPAAAKPAAAKPAAAKPAAEVTKVGEYEVLVGAKAVAFWPLLPGTTLAQAMPPIVSSPTKATGKNTAFNPVFGLVDIVVRMTDEVVEEKVDDPLLARQVGGPAKLSKGPLIREANGDIPITFAVDQSKIAKGGVWKGSLRLTATQPDGKTKTARNVEVKLKVKRQERVAGLFVFFVVHSRPKKTNAWVRLNVVDAADGKTPISGAKVKLKLLRDNDPKHGYAKINRGIELKSDSAGYLECGKDRTTLALPIEWPLILNAEAAGHVPRGHMLKIAAAEAKKDQTSPFLPAEPIRMTATAKASLAGKTIVLDPGHGVVYGLKKQRRSQEWYVAHRLADRIAEILVAEHKVARKDILFTKTAGFALIEPGKVRAAGAPELGAGRFEADLVLWRVRARLPAVRLDEISSLLLTRHKGNADKAVTPSVDDRNNWLAANSTAINAIVARVDKTLAAKHRRVQAGSVEWNKKTSRYVYTEESTKTPAVGATTVNLPVTPADWFALDTDELDVLVDRSVLWSFRCEMSGKSDFQARARAAMNKKGALAYMRDCVLRYLLVKAPHPYLTGYHQALPRTFPEMGWTPAQRNQFFNNEAASSDLIVAIHENAFDGTLIGAAMMVGYAKPGTRDAFPDDQVRIAKMFAKYLDPFDQGFRNGAVVQAKPEVGELNRGNRHRDVLAYFETEFMDAADPKHAGHFRFEEMTTDAYIERVARQIVYGIVEVLLDPQSDMDPITYSSGSRRINGLW